MFHLDNKLGQFWLRPKICENIVPDISSLLESQTSSGPGEKANLSINVRRPNALSGLE